MCTRNRAAGAPQQCSERHLGLAGWCGGPPSPLEGALGLLGSGWTGQMELQVAEIVGISRQADGPDEIIGSAAQIRTQVSMVLL